MRRIGPRGAFMTESHTGVCTAFRPMPMNDVSVRLADAAHDMRDRQAVARIDIPAHRNTGEAKRQRRSERLERRFGAFAAGIAIRDQADAMAARGLLTRDIDNVPE